LGERRFARAGRPVEDERLYPIRLDGAAQQLALTKEMRLSAELVERSRAHSGGKRLVPKR
jgi:hypothetical protein